MLSLCIFLCCVSLTHLVTVRGESNEFRLGEFVVKTSGLSVQIIHEDSSPDFVTWQTLGEKAFIHVGNASLPRSPILDGNFQMEEDVIFTSSVQTVEAIGYGDEKKTEVVMRGKLGDESSYFFIDYVFTISTSSLSSRQLHFDVAVSEDSTSSLNRLYLQYASDANESFHGFGESFTDFDMNGRRIPILVSEQGVGRGIKPLTDIMNAMAEGSGGHWYTTYCPKPLYLTNQNRSVVFENSEVMYIDLTADNVVEAEVWALNMRGNILAGLTMRDVIYEITTITGRMMAPPEWSQMGAVMGLEGGTTEVQSLVQQLKDGGVPVSAVWLQDWVGLRHDWDGDRLLWNWEVNYDWYPGWQDMVGAWKEDDIRVMTYVNPFFSDPSQYTNQSRHNFYQEGIEKGYFVKKSDGSEYEMYSLSIKFCMVDLTNPDAVDWMKSIIKKFSIEEAMSSGWMADFGEYLPFDAVLHSGEDAASYHNKYPQDWAKLTAEVLKESGHDGDILYFMRSAWLQSPQYNSVFWEGDQLVSWDRNDGLKSVILGALSGGISGHTISHSDIGGYTVVDYPPPRCNFMRSEELLNRWTELAAFGSALFRTHVGSSTSTENFNVYDSPESIAHFAKFADIYAALKPYRDGLIAEASTLGLPLIRPLAMNYGYDEAVWSIDEAYLFGDDFLVAPCMDEGRKFVRVYFPAFSRTWVHLWTGHTIASNAAEGQNKIIRAPIGFPPVFYKSGSYYGELLRQHVISKGYTRNIVWEE